MDVVQQMDVACLHNVRTVGSQLALLGRFQRQRGKRPRRPIAFHVPHAREGQVRRDQQRPFRLNRVEQPPSGGHAEVLIIVEGRGVVWQAELERDVQHVSDEVGGLPA